MTMGSRSTPTLFEEAAFGPVTVRNRIVMPAMATLFGEENGTVSPSLLAYYARRARGGAGLVIVETFRENGISPMEVPAALVGSHGPFTWGRNPREAVKHSVILEFIARMDADLRSFHAAQGRPPHVLVEKHFLRKHGKDAYYGQR